MANTVAEVTVTPTKNDSGATIEYLDGSDMTLTDAGTADGHQVTLAEGDNVIKVKVTAADGNDHRDLHGDGDPGGGGHVHDLHAEHRRPLVRRDDRGGIHAERSFWHLERFLHRVSGNLVPDEFTDDGTSYSIYGIYYVTEAVFGSFAAGTLVLDGNPKLPNGLTFQVGGAEFSITSALRRLVTTVSFGPALASTGPSATYVTAAAEREAPNNAPVFSDDGCRRARCPRTAPRTPTSATR